MNCSNGIDVDASANVDKALATVNVLLGFAVCFLGISVLVVLFLLDKHLFYYQRLIMYLNVTVIFGGFVSLTSINPYFQDDGETTNSVFCTINGLLFNWSVLSQCIMIWWISIVVFRLCLHNANAFTTSENICNNKVSKVEIMYVLATFFVPLLLVWVPALPSIDLYGPDGPICDIKIYSKCERIMLGYILQGIYRLLPLAVSVIVLPVLVIVSMFKIKKDFQRTQNCTHQHQETADIKRTALQLQVYPIIFIASSIAPALYLALDPTQDHIVSKYIVYTVYILINNLRGIVVSLMSAFDKDTRLRLHKVNLSLAFQRFLKRDSEPNRYFQYSVTNLYTDYGDSLDSNEMKQRDLERRLI